jgi:MFS family permease
MSHAHASRPAFGTRALLRLRDFRLLFAAQAISDVGDGLTYLSLFLLVNQLTHSAAALAVMSIAIALPAMTLGLFAGAYADRLDRRRIMLVSDTLRGLLVLGFVVLGTVERLPILYALAFVQASIGTFFTPARGALIPRVVPEEGLLAANSLGQVSRVIATVVGTGLAGLMVGVTGQFWPAFVVDAATFFASVALVLRVDRSVGVVVHAADADGSGGVVASVVEGLRAMVHSPVLLGTLTGAAVAMLGLGGVNVLFIPFLINELGASPVWAGPLEAAQTLSMVLAGAVVAGLASRIAPTRILSGALVGVAVVVGALAFVPNIWVLMAALFAVGWFITPVHAAASTLLQTGAPDSLRGRVMAAFQASTSTTMILSTAVAGLAADQIGIRTVFLVGGAIVALGAVISALLFAIGPRTAPVAGAAVAETALADRGVMPGR